MTALSMPKQWGICRGNAVRVMGVGIWWRTVLWECNYATMQLCNSVANWRWVKATVENCVSGPNAFKLRILGPEQVEWGETEYGIAVNSNRSNHIRCLVQLSLGLLQGHLFMTTVYITKNLGLKINSDVFALFVFDNNLFPHTTF